jgi:hypothetical protein
MTTPLFLGKDANGFVTFELPISDTKQRTTLAANTAQSCTVPPNMKRAFFSYSNGVDVWVDFKNGEAATLPGGAFASTNSELNPVARYGLIPGNTISFISSTTAYVGVIFFP